MTIVQAWRQRLFSVALGCWSDPVLPPGIILTGDAVSVPIHLGSGTMLVEKFRFCSRPHLAAILAAIASEPWLDSGLRCRRIDGLVLLLHGVLVAGVHG
jgi:hypothetical protein